MEAAPSFNYLPKEVNTATTPEDFFYKRNNFIL